MNRHIIEESDIIDIDALIAQGVSEDAARFILYGPDSENEECPDLE